MVIEFGAAKEARNLAKHGLSLSLAADFTEAAVVIPTYPGTDAVRYRMIERTTNGVLTAIVTPRGATIRVISLRRANRQEERLYGEALR